MQLRRFTSDSTSKALQAVREAFGDEAVILSNRQVDGRVEIIATGTFDENAVMATATASEIVTPVPGPAVPAEPAGTASASAATAPVSGHASAPAASSAAGSAPASVPTDESFPAGAAEGASGAAFVPTPVPVSPFVPGSVPAAAAVNAPRHAPPGDDEVTVSLSSTARAAAEAAAASPAASAATSNADDVSPADETRARDELPRTAPAFSSMAGTNESAGDGFRTDTDTDPHADGAASAAETTSAIDSLSRDLEAMSGDERPLTLGPVPDAEALAIDRGDRQERECRAPGESGAARDVAPTTPASPPRAVPAASAADPEAPGGASTVAAIGQVLAVAERRHAERARRLEQRFLRLEVNLWGELEPLRSAHLRQLVRLGVGMELAVRLVERITVGMSADTAMRQSLALLKATLPVGIDNSGRTPGVTVLSGPAGGGKTSTLVKLATRQVRLHGAQSTVLVAADARRIGAFEALQAYGRLLGVPVVQARTPDELAERIASFAHKPLVLVDHVPLELADALPLPPASALGDCDGVVRELRRLLVLPATLEPSVFEAQVALHRRHGISHAVLTQLDRATRLAGCFAPLIRHALPIAHVSDDARVLTPLGNADAATLVATAMTHGRDKASDKDEELLLNLLQPTRRVIESVTGAAGTDAAKAGAARSSCAGASGSNPARPGATRTDASRPDVAGSDASRSDATRTSVAREETNVGERIAEPVGGPAGTAGDEAGGTARPSPHEAAVGGAPVRPGTLERIVAFEAVDRDSVIGSGGIDAIETQEVAETLGELPPALLDEPTSGPDTRGRRARGERRTRRGGNDRTKRQETRR